MTASMADRTSHRPKTVTSQGLFQTVPPSVCQQSWRSGAESRAGARAELSRTPTPWHKGTRKRRRDVLRFDPK
jgi:hypothetical protein